MVALPAFPARRDVLGMTKTLLELREGDPLTVLFRTPRHGPFLFDGWAIRSPAVGAFMVGSLFIESGCKPDRSVQALEPGVVLAEEVDEVATGVPLEHGDLVKATSQRYPHGRFTITGLVVATVDNQTLTLGSWFLRSRGRPGVALRHLTPLAVSHRVPVPARIEWVAAAA
ncbi:hypothetical protein CLV40_1271 [Actinokineospora auranticolor]|uniref:Uncharacterized protein n=2 Tax=Actinokineospora auranticolor TaxID=155976 RepID=A0A2S6GE18_9PSEU|nr:hypothetical protein CLV40_1271 [Actinokineospora auranticolor]